MSEQQKPTVGRIVHVPMPPSANNGADTAPAIITRVDEDTEQINVRIFADSTASPQEWRTSLTYADELDYNPDDKASMYFWTWPARD